MREHAMGGPVIGEQLDLATIRAIAASGGQVTNEMVVALCDETERWRRQASLWADNIEDLTRERDGLLACARAWAGAIEGAGRGGD